MPFFIFKSTVFEVEPFEDKNNTPGVYGKGLATWIRRQLESRNYKVAKDIVPRGGWEVRVLDVPYTLWVECANLHLQSTTEWCVFVNAEPGVFHRTFKKAAVETAMEALELEIEDILNGEPGITGLRKQEDDPYRPS
jgi:hypothetical protein